MGNRTHRLSKKTNAVTKGNSCLRAGAVWKLIAPLIWPELCLGCSQSCGLTSLEGMVRADEEWGYNRHIFY